LELSLADWIERCGKFAAPNRVTDGKGFRLKDHDPSDEHSHRCRSQGLQRQ
jgi:hypothetical protein